MTFYSLLKEGEEKLEQAGVPESRLNAWYLFSDSFRMSRACYYLHNQEEAPEEETRLYRKRLERKKNREPVQYILGSQDFMGLHFKVSPQVLIPRQDTETLVEEVLSDWKKEGEEKIHGLDLCTGSGCIGISLAHLGGFRMDASDISRDALAVAKENAAAYDCPVRFLESDLFSSIPSCRYDLIVSNPPYIRKQDLETLMPEVKDFEPEMALDGKEDGLFFYRKIGREGGKYLRDHGKIYLEIGWDQAQDVKRILEENGFYRIQTVRDGAGKDRVIKAFWRVSYV